MPWTLVFVLGIFAPLVAINVYVGRRILDALVTVIGWNRQKVRRALALLLVCANLLPPTFLIAYALYGRAGTIAFAGESFLTDLFFTYPFWLTLVIVVQLFLVFVLSELVKLLLLPLYRKFKERWKRKEQVGTLVLTAFIVLYSVITVYLNTWTVRIVERDVHVPAQFNALDGVRIVQISDVQGDGRTNEKKLRAYVAKVNSLKPDIILFAGDVVTSGTKYIESTVSILGELKAAYGVYAAVGDHDIFSDKQGVVEGFRANGITVVEDTTLQLSINSTPIDLSVVTYTYRQRPDQKQLSARANGNNGAYKILLVHQPAESIAEFAQRHGYQLMLAGHTHGGGIAFGIPGWFLVAPATFESHYMSGFYQVNDLLISVTNGLGFTLAPIRFHAPAEITVLTLKR